MSVATEFAPVVFVPSRARQAQHPGATVIDLRPPSQQSIADPLRLTRRGVIVATLAVALLAVALVGLAWLSAPTVRSTVRPPASVAVRTGDTLWSIATRVAPQRDPRAEVAELQRVNHLSGVDLIAGQVLLTG